MGVYVDFIITVKRPKGLEALIWNWDGLRVALTLYS